MYCDIKSILLREMSLVVINPRTLVATNKGVSSIDEEHSSGCSINFSANRSSMPKSSSRSNKTGQPDIGEEVTINY
jgi:hypothetical protein